MKFVITVLWTQVNKMRRSELIARLNSLRHELESMEDDDGWNLETVETCLYYFIDEEDADPHWE